jgi:exopolysaccharide biosynthesis polyprenyl glycosylphosphotransferase
VSRGRFIVLSVIMDAVLVNVGIVAAFFVRFGGELPSFNFAPYVALAPLITAMYLASGYVFGLYEPERTEGSWELIRAVFQSITLGMVLTVAVAFFAGPRFFSISRLAIVISWAVQFLLLIGWRLLLLSFTSVLWPEQRILVVGTTDLAVELADELQQRDAWGHRVVGLVSCGDADPASDLHFPVLGAADDLTRIIASERIDRVIVASPVALRELIEEMALSSESDVRVEVIPELYEIFIGTVDSTVSDIPLMEITRPATPGWYISTKRLLDVVISGIALVAVLPLFAVVALGILLTMGWPVMFRQERVGRAGRTFQVFKFRTMVKNAEALSGPVLAEEADPRITPLGRVLRTSRIDELPQLLNILLGHMSFVGPRPERPFFVDQYVAEIPGYRERFKVKPGVTGLAQVSGGYATTPERKLKFDLIYMYHQNLLMDLQILVETVRVVLTGRGAR